MPSTVQVPGAELSCSSRGAGPPVLLVHGMADRAEGWSEVAAQLADRGLRAVAYDRRAYGASTAPAAYERTTVTEQSEDAAALLEALGAAPAVVAGRDLGAMVALDLVRRHRPLVAGVVAVDPPLYAFSAAATEALGAERIALETALRDSGPAGAVRGWLAARGVEGRRLEWAGEDHAAFFADFAALATWPVLRRDLRAVDVPVAVLVSPGAAPHDRHAAESLAEFVPGATLARTDAVDPDADLVAAIHRLA